MAKDATSKKSPWVFIVEDDVFINKAYSAKFAHEGIEVKIAEDGEKALEMLAKGETPTLILLDLMLPKKSGFEVLEEIKKDPRLKDIPVLILTNLAQELDANRGLSMGAKEYLIKTDLRIEDLVNKVKQYLESSK
ncbi:MAG TPA: response regulator [Candidatus Methylomirabilis sp.]|nr:response regulator [Candidatus Methylomirabilis sp.]